MHSVYLALGTRKVLCAIYTFLCIHSFIQTVVGDSKSYTGGFYTVQHVASKRLIHRYSTRVGQILYVPRGFRKK